MVIELELMSSRLIRVTKFDFDDRRFTVPLRELVSALNWADADLRKTYGPRA